MNWQFAVGLTDEAKSEYRRLQLVAESQVSLRPLPFNRDPNSRAQLERIQHYERTRNILSGLRNPAASTLDLRLAGRLSFMRYWTEIGTCVYFIREITVAPIVTVIHICDSPLDHDALYKIVASGNTQYLDRIGLPIPPDIWRLPPARPRATVH